MSMANVLLVPYPCQGHINPMLQLAKRLASKGVPATLVVTRFIARTARFDAGPVRVESISDGHDEGGFPSAAIVEEYVKKLESTGSASLAALIEAGQPPFTCVVYDSFVHWAARTARGLGLPAVPFSTQSSAASAVYYYVNNGLLKVPPPGDAGARSDAVAGLPGLERWEFPSFVFHDGPYPALTVPALTQFADRDGGDWVLVNSFDELEYEVLDGLKGHFKVRAIGPCAPLPAADESGDGDRYTYGANLLDPEDTCIKWLDAKSPRSVVYVSFGSNASLGASQMEEVARGLLTAGKPFLWVVRANEEAQLPRHLLDAATASGDALVVGWSPQLDVLAHRAVGCFVTHSGWNSTLEALGFGVPMVGLPLLTDQPINARLVEEAWGVGVRARRDPAAGLFARGEIEHCVRAVMEDEDGKAASARAAARRLSDAARAVLAPGGGSDKKLGEFLEFACAVMDDGVIEPSPREAARRWSDAARAAVAPGGSSDQNLDKFVDFLRASAGGK